MIRQGLEADAAYVDAAVHGDGLTSVQFRAEKGGQTQEVQSNVAGAGAGADRAPGRLRASLRGRGRPAAPLLRRGRSRRVQRHRSTSGSGSARTTRTKWSRRASATSWSRPLAAPAKPPVLYSTLETVPLGTGSTDRRVQYVSTTRFEAPNWYPDGKAWLVNSGGKLLKIPMGGGAAETVDTGSRTRNNNDHGISKDGSTIVISDQTEGATASAAGRRASTRCRSPAASRSWSRRTRRPTGTASRPTARRYVYCAQRDGEFDVYTHPVRRRRGDGGSRPRPASTTARSTRPTASGSTSTRCAPG